MSNRPETTQTSCPVYKMRAVNCKICHIPNSLNSSRESRKPLKRGNVEKLSEWKTPYRNKVQAAFYTDKKGKTISGVYQSGSHHVVELTAVRQRMLLPTKLSLQYASSSPFRMTTYNYDTGKRFSPSHSCEVLRLYDKSDYACACDRYTCFSSKNNFAVLTWNSFQNHNHCAKI